MTSGSLSDILKKIITTQTQQFAKETLKKSKICCQKEQGLINTQLNKMKKWTSDVVSVLRELTAWGRRVNVCGRMLGLSVESGSL